MSNRDADSLKKRLVVARQVGSPLTEVKPGDTFPIVGQDLTLSDGPYTATFTLGSETLTTQTIDVSSHAYQILATAPLTISDGSQQLCVNIGNSNLCSSLFICSSCEPKLGFIFGNVDIAHPSMGLYKPPGGTATFGLVGDAFSPLESVEIEIDGTLTLSNVPVDGTGRFSAELTMLVDEPYGGHNVTVIGQEIGCKLADSASATFTLVRFINF